MGMKTGKTMKMMIFVGKDCRVCETLRPIVLKVTSELGLEEGRDWERLVIEEGDNFLKALQYQAAASPSIIIDGKMAFSGKIPTEEELMEALR